MSVTLIFYGCASSFFGPIRIIKHGDGMGHNIVKAVLQETLCFSTHLIEIA